MKVTWRLFPPCHENKSVTSVVDLIFFADIILPLTDVPGHHCFADVFQLNPRIPDCHNVYPLAGPHIFFSYMLGLDMHRNYSSVLQMEVDSVPIKRFWLRKVLQDVFRKTNGDVWIHAAINKKNLNHFNGNAAYNILNLQFRDFLLTYRDWYYSVAVKSRDTAFDTNFINYALASGRYNEFTQHQHASQLLRNCHLMSILDCSNVRDSEIWGSGRSAVIVHSHNFKDAKHVKNQILKELLAH